MARRLSSLLVAACTAATLQACKQRDGGAATVKLINGVETDEMPAVVQLLIDKNGVWSGCTGVYLDASTLVTALHCVADGMTGLVYPATVGNLDQAVQAASYYDDAYLKGLHSTRVTPEHDFAVLRYDPAFATQLGISDFLPLAPGRARAGAAVTMVGFGATVLGGSGGDLKRMGTNAVSEVADGKLTVAGVAHPVAGQPAGVGVSVAGGDSGGPLLDEQRRILGLCSFERWDLAHNWVASEYFAVSSPLAQRLLAQAGWAGALGMTAAGAAAAAP